MFSQSERIDMEVRDLASTAASLSMTSNTSSAAVNSSENRQTTVQCAQSTGTVLGNPAPISQDGGTVLGGPTSSGVLIVFALQTNECKAKPKKAANKRKKPKRKTEAASSAQGNGSPGVSGSGKSSMIVVPDDSDSDPEQEGIDGYRKG